MELNNDEVMFLKRNIDFEIDYSDELADAEAEIVSLEMQQNEIKDRLRESRIRLRSLQKLDITAKTLKKRLDE